MIRSGVGKLGPSSRRPAREFEFVPRVVNPVRIRRAIIVAADEQLRTSGAVLRQQMPWVGVTVLLDPVSASNHAAGEPTVFLFDDTAMTLVDAARIRKENHDAVIVLLSSNPFVQCSPPTAAQQRFRYTSAADLVFATSRSEFPPSRIIASAVRAAEDRLNIANYSKVRRYIFLIVDDEPRWFSQFLPVLYGIIGQRADVMITRTYEETLAFLFGVEDESGIDPERFRLQGHGDDVVCLITDIFFPKGRELARDAGRDLIRLVRRFYPRYPIVVASKAKEAEDPGGEALLMPKGDPGSLEKLRDYIQNFTGMGDFIIRDESGEEIHRVRTIQELYRTLQEAETDTPVGRTLRGRLDVYAESDGFSTWLYMHSFRELGDRLRPLRLSGSRMIHALKRNLMREILRMQRTPLIVDGVKVYDLPDLLAALRTVDPAVIQPLSDDDVVSSWLDRKGYPELAEELRPIHGSGADLLYELAGRVEKWIGFYAGRPRPT